MLRNAVKYAGRRFGLSTRQLTTIILVYVVLGILLGLAPLVVIWLGLWP